mgnify:FL=1
MSLKLDVFGQQPLLRIYTQLVFCYADPKHTDPNLVVSRLAKGISKLRNIVPWIGGTIFDENGVVRLTEDGNGNILTVKDLRKHAYYPNFAELRREDFPFKWLNEKHICPRMTIPGTQNEVNKNAECPFLIQLTVINGGILLSFLGEHALMDMGGQFGLMEALSKLCKGEKLTDYDQSRIKLNNACVPIYDDGYILPQEDKIIRRKINETVNDCACEWKYLRFSRNSLLQLKQACSKELKDGFVSTDDCLSALIWRSILKARLKRQAEKQVVYFYRAIDTRRYLGYYSNQMGVFVNMALTRSSIGDVLSTRLGAIAALLRTKVDRDSVVTNSKIIATKIHRAKDKNNISVTQDLDSSLDIQISSWSKFKCFDLDFGIGLGKPIAVRRPEFIPLEGLIYFMPKTLNGSIIAGLCLRKDDYDEIMLDDDFMKYCNVIC